MLDQRCCCFFVLQPLHQALLVEGQEYQAGDAAAEALDGQEEPVGLETMLAQASVCEGRARSAKCMSWKMLHGCMAACMWPAKVLWQGCYDGHVAASVYSAVHKGPAAAWMMTLAI